MNISVSVCVQTYQHSSFIKECLESILAQVTDFKFEILLGEDCSSDGTREICIEYANMYPGKIKLFLHSRETNISINGKPTGRYNFLNNYKHVSGKYIAFCEGDDYWTDKYKLQKQFNFLETNPDYVLCCHPVKIIEGPATSYTSVVPVSSDSADISDLARVNFVYTPSTFLRNKLPDKIPNFFYSVPYLDYVIFMIIAQHGKIKILPDTMAVYRRHMGGIWTGLSRIEQLINQQQVVNELIRYFHGNKPVVQELGKQKLDGLVELMGIYNDTDEKDKMSDCLRTLSETEPGIFLDYINGILQEKAIVMQKLHRLAAHPVAGNLIRLLAKIKRDPGFGSV